MGGFTPNMEGEDKSLVRRILKNYIARVLRFIGRILYAGYHNGGTNYQIFTYEEKQASYQHFKKYFYDSLIFESLQSLQAYTIKEALTSFPRPTGKNIADGLYLEFGVEDG